MRYFSLFAGIGGFELGIERACKKHYKKAQCVGFSEINKYALTVYEQHFPQHKNFGDITRIALGNLSDFDLLVGGFPCQPFSQNGKRRGFEDPRGKLFFLIIKLLKEKRPAHFILENVPGLLSHDSGHTFQRMLIALKHAGYRTEWQVLNSKDFGVPQNRRRVFIVGHRRDKSCFTIFPLEEHHAPDIVLPTLTARYYGAQATGGYIGQEHAKSGAIIKLRRLTPLECERLQGFPDHFTRGIPDARRYECLGNAVTVNVVEAVVVALLSAQHIRRCSANA